ncbi:MAG TPA: ISKra4 family transposase [Terriglobia bacterium]
MPVASGGGGSRGGEGRGKKTAEAIRQEIGREVDQVLRVVFQERRKTGRIDLEATEMAMRAALHRAGATALTQLLQFPAPPNAPRTVPCPCGQSASYHQLRAKPVLTAVGWAEVSRPYYGCPTCHRGQFPADRELDIENTEFSPGVRRMQALVGQAAPFDRGREQMHVLAGLEVTTKSVERTAEGLGADIAQREQKKTQQALQLPLPAVAGEPIPILYVQMDGTGVPVVKKETLGRQGKIEGQPAHTREVKLGCVFTQTTWDEEGYPIRAPDSTTYTGAVETAQEFGRRLFREAWTRGWSRAHLRVVMGDGAEWIWNLAAEHFHGALQIVDLYHARQHLWEIARTLYPNQAVPQKAWMKIYQKRLLDKGKIEKLVGALRSIRSRNPQVAAQLRIEADYFERNAERMRYPKFRRQHLFVGSGVIEAGCKTVIASRLKQSGMFWTLRGANAILALRCALLNRRFEDYWENRREALAA